MKIYNTMTRKKEEFVPINKNEVKMYACGITVYDACHIGHARQAITYEMISQYLRYKGYNVTYVRNYTDVDDKIIARANERGENALEYSARKIEEAEKDLGDLGVIDADIKPKASENIDNIIKFVSELIEKGSAYVTEKGDVYYSVESFPEYGKLSRRKTEELIDGVRKEVEEGKRDPKDFALWKSAKEGEISWTSPWGEGRPGWHIECSAMILNNLGETIDIHGGGRDLIFPHHENEIAQTEALTGKPIAKYWTHNGLVKINGQKMSKSLGNCMTIREALEKYDPEVIRYAMLSKHYSSDIDLGEKEFAIAENHLYYFYSTLQKLENAVQNMENQEHFTNNDGSNSKSVTQEESNNDIAEKIKKDFIKAMDDDFNSLAAIAQLFPTCKYVNSFIEDTKYSNDEKIKILKEISKTLKETYSVLGLLKRKPEEFISELREKYIKKTGLNVNEVETLIQERQQAKQKKDYQKADEIREQLGTKGILLKDSKEGTIWDFKALYDVIYDT